MVIPIVITCGYHGDSSALPLCGNHTNVKVIFLVVTLVTVRYFISGVVTILM